MYGRLKPHRGTIHRLAVFETGQDEIISRDLNSRLFKAHHVPVKLEVLVVSLTHFWTHRDDLEVSRDLLQDLRIEISPAGVIPDTSEFLLRFFGEHEVDV